MNRLDLIADILNGQAEHLAPDDAALDAAGWAERLASGNLPTKAEVALIWTSPAARRAYLHGRRQIAAKARDGWRAGGWGVEAKLMAAASALDDFTLSVNGVAVMVTAIDDRWLIAVTVTPMAMAQVPTGFSLVLRDAGGHEWLRVPADQSGHAEGWWTLTGETPAQRLASGPMSIDIR